MIFLEALRKQYEADIVTARTNIAMYLQNSVAVADHGELVESFKQQVEKLSKAEGLLRTVEGLEKEVSNSTVETEPE